MSDGNGSLGVGPVRGSGPGVGIAFTLLILVAVGVIVWLVWKLAAPIEKLTSAADDVLGVATGAKGYSIYEDDGGNRIAADVVSWSKHLWYQSNSWWLGPTGIYDEDADPFIVGTTANTAARQKLTEGS